jgi:acetolactate synthase-1/2/3 large subunit
VLQAAHVDTVFTLCGGHISPILVAAKRAGIVVVDVRDEATAVFAADAQARLTGRAGVAAVTAGPGVANTITAVKNAQLAQSPVVLLGGATATILKGRGSLQDIDQMALVRPHVKWASPVRRVADLGPRLAEAFARSRDGVPGPVFVECPVDLLYPESLVRQWHLAGFEHPRSLAQRGMRWYLQRHLDRVFAPGSDDVTVQAPRRGRSTGVAALVRRAATALGRASRPVVLVGSQAVSAGARVDDLARALDRLGMPVFLSGMARGLLGPAHALQFRHQRKAALREADLVLLAGTPCDFRLDYGRQISRRAALVSVNLSPVELTKNRRPTIGAVAPADEFIAALADLGVPRRGEWSTWVERLREREMAREGEIDGMAGATAPPVNPLRLCQAIDRTAGTDAVFVADGGDFVATASYILRPRAPLSWLDPGVFGTLGVGAGFILGVHRARPGAEIWAIFGDGALGFSLSEFDTLARHRVPVVAVVGNDGKWAQIARDQVHVLGDDVGTGIGQAAYHRVVDGLGGRGFLLDDPACVDTTLAAARDAAREGVPVLVNALIGDTEFRKGSMSL